MYWVCFPTPDEEGGLSEPCNRVPLALEQKQNCLSPRGMNVRFEGRGEEYQTESQRGSNGGSQGNMLECFLHLQRSGVGESGDRSTG